MNGNELEAVRRALFLNVTEAANEIPARPVNSRTWRKWESGYQKRGGEVFQANVPDDVEHNILFALKHKNTILTDLIDFFDELDLLEIDSEILVSWYSDMDSFQAYYGTKSIYLWRLHQAICISLFSDELIDGLCEPQEAGNWKRLDNHFLAV